MGMLICVQPPSLQIFPSSATMKKIQRRVFDVKSKKEIIVVTVCPASISNVLHT